VECLQVHLGEPELARQAGDQVNLVQVRQTDDHVQEDPRAHLRG
jgi:hypothetical protein